jgi:chorismate mutase/prephenate dehydrogenase
MDQADMEIARAIRRRLQVAAAIGRAKGRIGGPLRDFSREARVLERWRKQLSSSGVARPRTEALARWLIEESLRVQESVPARRGRRPPSGQRITIVGGAGGMGRWLDGFLTDAGHEVRIVDPRASPRSRRTLATIAAAVAESDLVAFATPIRATAALMEEAFEHRSNAVVFDLLSVKAPIVPVLDRARREGRRVTSVHPMFGPTARTLSGRNLLLVSCGDADADRVVRALFERSALSVTAIPIERHDRLVAESLGLAHAVNLLFLSALAEDPFTSHDLARTASTTFHRQSALAAAVAREGPELYFDIQSLNPHSRETFGELRAALARLTTIVERESLDEFRGLLEAGRAKLDPGPEPMRA